MQEKSEEDENEEFLPEDFSDLLDKLKKKSKKYQYLLKAGYDTQHLIFKIYSWVWKHEKRPENWEITDVIQIFKGKLDPNDLDFYRNIHMKDWFPKAFENAVVQKSKEKIINKVTKYQIGAIPGHRPAEHLFVIKSMINLYLTV